MRLYRAVSQLELHDIAVDGRFRLNTDAFAYGKWFAFSLEDATSWGCRFAGFDGLSYFVVAAEVAEATFDQFDTRESLDGIGRAVFVEETQLSELTVITVPESYILCEDGVIRVTGSP